MCKDRDEFCVITKASTAEVCHIFPFVNKQHPQLASQVLRNLHWMIPQNHMRHMVKILYEENKIDTPENMVTLSLNAYQLWSRGVIAFEPLMKHEDHVVLKLRWLKTRNTANSKDISPYGLADLAADPNDVLHDYPEDVKLIDNKNYRPILDGHEVVIKSTPDCKCPDWDILMFQWYLCRMSSLCAAAEAVDDETEDRDDEDIGNLTASMAGFGLDEVTRGRTSQRRSHPFSRSSRPSFMRASTRSRSSCREQSISSLIGSPLPPRPRARSRSPSPTLKTESPHANPRRRVGGGSNQENEAVE